MLVALAVTLVMMAAVVNLFANISGSIRNRRAVIELGGQLRQARQRLSLDLAGATCPARTWQRPGEDRGYIEIVEGQWSDANPSELLVDGDGDGFPDGIDLTTSLVPGSQLVNTDAGAVTDARALGDHDDILALTVRSESEPFVAQVQNPATGNMETVESHLAEVLWFAIETPDGASPPDEPGMRKIYRRVLLIAPQLGPWTNPPDNISARWDGTRWIANTIGDLSKRENRVERRVPSDGFSFPISGMNSSAAEERLMLNDALAFDVRVYDPGAPLYEAAPGMVVQPGDPGWLKQASAGPPSNPAGYGAYCDLGWNWNLATKQPYLTGGWLPSIASTPTFSIPHQVGWSPNFGALSPYALLGFPAVYDTWSFHYENDGIDQETFLENLYRPANPRPQFAAWQKNTLDQGTNGLDDDNVNGVDDAGERETSPPYDVPLRGVKVILRVYERDARQIREASVTHSFVP
jgi:hypothetical protein